ncbi:uncharacterized protein Dana_GF17228 [Drosophila ananassae]|uniref:Uncharacterized protein n=1 Tax=Drosophila ananassae TaxID=7217 RepID=B3LZP3_DROAN|nr:uncharacterized protein LOC6500014 [Drosophila ananassae]EDV41985.1 uncharacterized protein Dana_GF17228 [Drosophila ananassae]
MRGQSAHVGAAWFTSLSDFQVQAIDGLFVALRDDSAEASVYRTQFCLSRLGITPMVRTRLLSKLITMSRCSDLAFLFFLREACYKPPEYAYSARILEGGIMYLDLEMTMRELDKILPPGVDITNKSNQHPTNRATHKMPVTENVKKKNTRSPYYVPLPKPKTPANFSSKFSSKPPLHVVSFPFWPAGEKPKYKVNENNRWFAAYRFEPIRRMLLDTVGEIMNEYWEDMGGAADLQPLCELHKEALKQAQLIKDEAVVKARDMANALMDLDTRKNEARKKQIIAMLDRDIEECTRRWQRLRRRDHTDVMLLDDENQMCSVDKVPTAVDSKKMKHICGEADVGKLNVAPNLGVHVIKGTRDVSLVKTLRISDLDVEPDCPTQPTERKLATCPPQLLGRKKPTKRVNMQQKMAEGVKDFGPCQKPLKKGRFFERPRPNGPFVFHYHEIAPRDANPGSFNVICNEAVRVIRDPESQMSCSSDNIYNCRLDPCTQVVAAIVACVEEMWSGSLEAYEQGHQDQEKDAADILNPCAREVVGSLDWTKTITHFDPNDKALMDRLLKDGFTELRKDPRCVYASFPNSHKSFVMLEWIKRRYGKTYTQKEICRLVRKGLPVFNRIASTMTNPPSPKPEGFTPEDTYDEEERLTKLANDLKNAYRMDFNNGILDKARKLWMAMVPHLNKDSSMIKTFYAYLPVRYTDMLA